MEYLTLIDFLPIVMFATLLVMLFTGFPVAMVMGGVALIFGIVGVAFGIFRMQEFYILLPRIWGGVAENLVLIAIPMYFFMGTMLERSGVAERLLRSLGLLLAPVPGGLAMAVTLMGLVMAATTGVIAASVVLMTMLALPTMLAAGYSRPLSAGIIAAAGTLGIIVPPSIMLIILGDLMSISVGQLFLGAFAPGLILTGLYLCFILAAAIIKPELFPKPKGIDRPPTFRLWFKEIVGGLVAPLCLVFLVLGSIVAGWATATEASSVGAAGAIMLSISNRKFSFHMLSQVISRTTLLTGMAFLMLIGATAFAYVFRSLGGDYIVEAIVGSLDLTAWGEVALMLGVIFILGFFFDWIEIVLIVVPIFLPIILALDFGGHIAANDAAIWVAVLISVNLQTSFLTPPFGYAIFYLKGAARSSIKTPEIYRGVVPFVLLQLTALALCAFFPSIILWLPRAVLGAP